MAESWRTVRITIDEHTIATTDDPMVIIDPVWWLSDFYHGLDEYEKSLAQFTKAQRQVWAVLWFDSEVCNGGFHQFFSNSTGAVWPEALEGFEAMELMQAHQLLHDAVERMGGSPSLDGTERNTQLHNVCPDFDDLDDGYYKLIEEMDFAAAIMKFIRGRPQDFYFSGDVRKPVA